jgi:HlyD family secretion protein
MNADKLKSLEIDRAKKSRPQGMMWAIFAVVAVVTLAAIFVARPRAGDDVRLLKKSNSGASTSSTQNTGTVESSASADPTPASPSNQAATTTAASGDVALTVSGYIINRERIELSPRFMGVVKWIGVKKGDTVTNDQIVVLLDDTEYKARLAQAEAAAASSKANVSKAEILFERVNHLAKTDIESKQAQDDARLTVDAARATLKEAEAAQSVAKTYLDWCVIRSPINGVVLEKLVDPNELVAPQSFGGTRGPSTALIAVADPQDLQVEIDMNEADLSKISLNQKCRVSPEAYPDKTYEGYVAEVAPEANRAKGTLQIKVQIRNPDKFLTPELSAKVDFLK